MNTQKRGGARLKKNQQHSNTGSDTHSSEDKGKLSSRKKILLIVLASVLAVLLIVLLVYKSWAKLPDLPAFPKDKVTADPVTGEFPSAKPMAGSPRKKDFYTFIVAGRDTGGGGNTDTMMLVAYDIPNQRLAVMSLPRDTMVDANHPDSNRKLNGVWNLGLHYAKKDSKKEGVQYLKDALGDMLGFTPDFHVVVNWEAFGRLVDAIGGVEFDVPYNMKYSDPTQDLYINVAKGKRVLTGDEAMGVVRWRSGYATGDLGRIQTQQALMKEIVKKCLKIENVTKINEFAKIFTEEVETDLTLGNLVAFAERAIFGGLEMDNVIFATMPNTPVYVGGVSYVQANPDELLGMLNDSFNPYAVDMDMSALHILQYRSSTGYYTYSGTGNGTPPTYTDPHPAAAVAAPSGDSSAQESVPPDEEGDGEHDPDTPESDAPDSTEGAYPPGLGEREPVASDANSTPTPEPSPQPSDPAPETPPEEPPAGIPMD